MNIYAGEHPIYKVINDFLAYFSKYNFIHYQSNIITDKENNFYFLQCDQEHVTLSTKETFFINKDTMLRTHCTNFQQSFMLKYKNIINYGSVINGLNYGTVFRKDDSSQHSYFFHQIDSVMFNSNMSTNQFIDFIKKAITEVLKKQYEFRIRMSYFPFTDPSFEIDIHIDNQYIEILGCGNIHNTILNKVGIKTDKAFAFGMGIERIASILYHQPNIKLLRLL